jgi:hypothetical protein
MNAVFDKKAAPYRQDPALLYRELSGQYLALGQPQKAGHTARMAVQQRPLNPFNWRNWLYVWRKSLKT